MRPARASAAPGGTSPWMPLSRSEASASAPIGRQHAHADDVDVLPADPRRLAQPTLVLEPDGLVATDRGGVGGHRLEVDAVQVAVAEREVEQQPQRLAAVA